MGNNIVNTFEQDLSLSDSGIVGQIDKILDSFNQTLGYTRPFSREFPVIYKFFRRVGRMLGDILINQYKLVGTPKGIMRTLALLAIRIFLLLRIIGNAHTLRLLDAPLLLNLNPAHTKFLSLIKLMHDIETNPGPCFSKLADFELSNNCCSFCPFGSEPWDPVYDMIRLSNSLICLPSKCGCTEFQLEHFTRWLDENPGAPFSETYQHILCSLERSHGRAYTLISCYLNAYILDNHQINNTDLIRLRKFMSSRAQAGDWDLLGIKQLSRTVDEISKNTLMMLKEDFNPKIDKFNEQTQKFVENFDKVSVKSEQTLENVNSLMGNLNQFIDMLKDPTTGPAYFLIVYAIFEILGSIDRFKDAMKMLKFGVAAAGLCYYGVPAVKRLIFRWTNIGQSLDDWTSMLIEASTFTFFGRSLKFDTITEFGKSLTNLQKSTESCEKIITKIVDWFKRLMILISDTFNLGIRDYFETQHTSLARLQREADTILKAYIADPQHMSMATAERINKLAMEIIDLKLSITPSTSNQGVLIALERLNDKVMNLLKYAADSGVVLGERDEPVLLCLVGAPGAGKTYFSEFLAMYLAIMLCEDEELVDVKQTWKNHIYVWPIDNKHHDQYKGQSTVIFPDLFCQTDAEGMPGEAANLVYLAGCQPMTLPAAELIKKEKLYMISRAIVACTNVLRIHDNLFKSVRNPDAVRRRVNRHGYYFYVNEKYAEKRSDGSFYIDPATKRVLGYEDKKYDYLYAKIDDSKLPKVDGLAQDIWYFRKWDFTTGTFDEDEGGKILNQAAYFDLVLRSIKNARVAGLNKRRNMSIEADKIIKLRQGSAEGSVDSEIFFEPGFKEKIKSINSKRENKKNAHKLMKQMNSDDEFHDAFQFREAADILVEPKTYLNKLQDAAGYIISDNLPFSQLQFRTAQELYNTIVVNGMGMPNFSDIPMSTRAVLRHVGATDDVTSIIGAFMERVPMTNSNRIAREEEFWLELLDLPGMDVFAHFEFKHIRKMMLTPYEELKNVMLNCYYEECFKDPILAMIYQLRDITWSFTNEIRRACSYVTGEIMRGFNYIMTFPLVAAFTEAFLFSLSVYGGVFLAFIIFAKALELWFPVPPNVIKEQELRLKEKALELEEKEMKMKVSQGGIDYVKNDLRFIQGTYGNFFLLYLQRVTKSGLKGMQASIVTFLGQNIAFTVYHTVAFGKEYARKNPEDQILFTLVPLYSGKPENSTMRFRIEDLQFPEDEDLRKVDVQMIIFNRIQPFPNISKYLAPKKCLDWISEKVGIEGRFVRKLVNEGEPLGTPEMVSVKMNLNHKAMYYASMKVGETDVDLGEICFPAFGLRGTHEVFETAAGMCGSPGWITDSRKNFCTNMDWPQAQQPWLAYMHNSSQYNVPHGTPLYREMFQKYIDMLTKNHKFDVELFKDTLDGYSDVFEKHGYKAVSEGGITIEQEFRDLDKFHTGIATILPKLATSNRSCITRTPLYGLFPVTRVPARLTSYVDKRTGEFVDVMKKAREPYSSNTHFYNEKLFGMIIDNTTSRIMNDSSPPKDKSVLTFEEAIYGSQFYNLSPIDWSTSAGISLKLIFSKYGIKSKGRSFFANDGIPTEEGLLILKDLLEFHMNRLNNGEKFGNVFSDCLKDETLKFEKVIEGKTRLFCAGDLLFLIACRMYFGAFAGWIFDNKIVNGISIGINPHGKDWESLFAHLTRSPLRYIFGDYGKFDKRQKDVLMFATLSLVEKFYGFEDLTSNVIREQLFNEIVYSMHMVIETDSMILYPWSHGNTSGNFLTAIINSITNICCVHIACTLGEMLCRGKNIYKETDIKFDVVSSKITYNVLGDDIVLGVQPQIWNTFRSIKTMIETQLGLEFTDELKGDASDVPDYRELIDGTYLGRKIVVGELNGVLKVFAPLRLYSVIESPMWYKGIQDVQIEVEKAENTFVELRHHTRDVFEEYAKPLADAVYKHYGIYPKYSNYESAGVRLMSLITNKYTYDSWVLEDVDRELEVSEYENILGDLKKNC